MNYQARRFEFCQHIFSSYRFRFAVNIEIKIILAVPATAAVGAAFAFNQDKIFFGAAGVSFGTGAPFGPGAAAGAAASPPA